MKLKPGITTLDKSGGDMIKPAHNLGYRGSGVQESAHNAKSAMKPAVSK